MPTAKSGAAKAKKTQKKTSKPKKAAKKTSARPAARKAKTARKKPPARKKATKAAPSRSKPSSRTDSARPTTARKRTASPVFGVSPTYLEALGEYEKAMAVFHRREFDKAAAMFETIIAEHPGEKDLTDRARVYLNLCRQHTAREGRVRGFEDHYNRGVFHVNRGEHAEAVELFEKALKLEPDSEKVHYALAAALALRGDTERAMEHLRRAIGMNDANRLLARKDHDFEPLRGRAEFEELTGTAGAS